MAETYFMAARRDNSGLPIYYVRRGQHAPQYTIAPHRGAFMTEEVAQKICKRYGLTLEKETGYGVNYATFEELGEQESPRLLSAAVKTALADGLSSEQILQIVNTALESNHDT